MRLLVDMIETDRKAAEIYEEFRRDFLNIMNTDRSQNTLPPSCDRSQEEKMRDVLLRYSLGHRAQTIRTLLKNRTTRPH